MPEHARRARHPRAVDEDGTVTHVDAPRPLLDGSRGVDDRQVEVGPFREAVEHPRPVRRRLREDDRETDRFARRPAGGAALQRRARPGPTASAPPGAPHRRAASDRARGPRERGLTPSAAALGLRASAQAAARRASRPPYRASNASTSSRRASAACLAVPAGSASPPPARHASSARCPVRSGTICSICRKATRRRHSSCSSARRVEACASCRR